MIFVDPDLDPDPASSYTSMTKRASPPDSMPTNRNHRVPSARTLARFLREAQAAVRLRGQVSVLLTTDAGIRRLNRQFRGKNKATDVLSFPASEAVAGEVAGDLAVSVPTALRQAGLPKSRCCYCTGCCTWRDSITRQMVGRWPGGSGCSGGGWVCRRG